MPFDMPFESLRVLSKVEGLTALSKTEGLVEGGERRSDFGCHKALRRPFEGLEAGRATPALLCVSYPETAEILEH